MRLHYYTPTTDTETTPLQSSNGLNFSDTRNNLVGAINSWLWQTDPFAMDAQADCGELEPYCLNDTLKSN